jgi:hypothetical protein
MSIFFCIFAIYFSLQKLHLKNFPQILQLIKIHRTELDKLCLI